MKADTLTLSQLFNKPVSYIVPLFQRPYVWNKGDHWMPLWDDFRSVAERLISERNAASEEEIDRGVPEQRTPPHFLGAVVAEQLPTGAGMIDRRHVIDGQQRLATLQLFIDAAHDVAVDYQNDSARLFAKLTDNDPDLVQSMSDRYKVWPTNLDQSAFRVTLDNDSEPADGEDASSSAIWQAHEYFSEAIGEWLEEEETGDPTGKFDALRAVVWSLVRLVVIDLEPGDNAQVIFETLNARGTPLLASDLIKNHLFQSAAEQKLPIEPLYNESWRALDADWWREPVRQGRLYRPRLDIYFYHWLTMRRGSEFGVHELFPQFKRFYSESSDDTALTLRDITHHAKTYRGFDSFPRGTFEEAFFNRLRATETATATPPLLMVLALDEMSVPIEQKHKLMAAIESWLIRRMVCRLTTKNYNLMFLALLDRIREDPSSAGDTAVEYFRSLTSESRYWPGDEEVGYQVLTLPLYRLLSRGRLRMVLEAIEEAMRSPKSEEQLAPRGLPIEHILPQEWIEHWPLPPDIEPLEAASVRDTAKHTLGNLTLVTVKLNSGLSNAAWPRKRTALSEHTTLFLNKDVVNNHPDGWDEGTIQSRGEKLAEQVISIWPGPESDVWGIGAYTPPQPVIIGAEPTDTRKSLTSIVTSQPPGSRGEDAVARMVANHDSIRERTDSAFLLTAMDELEGWLSDRGFEVRHRKGTHHSIYRTGKWVGGYYFAKSWIHFWVQEPIDTDETLAGLSHPSTFRKHPKRVTGNLFEDRDLELFRKVVLSRA
jgi:uncharacterized protein with ParB-like and HNH nuclease domain